MSTPRIFIMLISIVIVFGIFVHLFTSTIVPSETDNQMIAFDMTRPRAPVEARAIKNPILPSKEVIAKGKALYLGKGNCFVCHGNEGKGDGESGVMLNPPPRDLTDPTFQMLRKDGELFYSIKHGVPDTGMFPYVPRMVSEEEAWMVVHYIRAIKREVE